MRAQVSYKMIQDADIKMHDELTEITETVAIISGYDLPFFVTLPDGSRPDVFRTDSRYGSIFLGDAKNTETPGCIETQKRLMRYLEWFKLLTRHRSGSLFVVCFNRPVLLTRWRIVLTQLSVEKGLTGFKVGSATVCDDLAFVWLSFLGRELIIPTKGH